MKRKIIIFLSVVAVLFGIYCVGIYIINTVFHAYHGKITLKVVNNDGHIVTNANVAVYFANQLFRNREYYKGVTDENGCFTAKGMSQGDILYQITKRGYYKTSESYWFTKEGTAERDKLRPWIVRYTPWNPTLEVILKEIRNPIPMYVNTPKIILPKRDKLYEFDMLVADIVEPYGKGTHGDIGLRYSLKKQSTLNFSNCLEISVLSLYDGFEVLNKDNYSSYRSKYLASRNSYTNRISLTVLRTSQDIIKNEVFDHSKYIVFRTRTVTDVNGNITNAYYGKIYGKIDYGSVSVKNGSNSSQCAVKFKYYFNPNPNDRNLEWNGSNLFDNTQWELHPSQESGRLK